MSENKRYYWLKLKEDFFDDDTIKWIEEQENGKEYCLFYLKLCLKSLKKDGIIIRNVGNSLIPYDMPALSKLTNTDIDTVVVAMKIFTDFGLIQVLENGEIYLSQLNNMIGKETQWAGYKRKERISKDVIPVIGQCPKNVQAELELELEKELELDVELEAKKQKPPTTATILKEEREKKKNRTEKLVYDFIRYTGIAENQVNARQIRQMVDTYNPDYFKIVAEKFVNYYATREESFNFNVIDKMWKWLADESCRADTSTIRKNIGLNYNDIKNI